MKVLYLSLTLYICNLMMRVSPYRTTYDRNGDSYKVVNWAIIPAAVLALIFRRHTGNFILDVGCGIFRLLSYAWTFSIYLEAVCIMPQIIMLQRYKEIENLTSNYVVLLGLYRFFYILNWINR